MVTLVKPTDSKRFKILFQLVRAPNVSITLYILNNGTVFLSSTTLLDSNKRVAGTNGGNSSGWADPRSAPDPRASVSAASVSAMDNMRSDLRAAAAASGLDPRQLDPREMRQMTGGDMRGDPRGMFDLLINSAKLTRAVTLTTIE